jgi:hypothetical protein
MLVCDEVRGHVMFIQADRVKFDVSRPCVLILNTEVIQRFSPVLCDPQHAGKILSRAIPLNIDVELYRILSSSME